MINPFGQVVIGATLFFQHDTFCWRKGFQMLCKISDCRLQDIPFFGAGHLGDRHTAEERCGLATKPRLAIMSWWNNSTNGANLYFGPHFYTLKCDIGKFIATAANKISTQMHWALIIPFAILKHQTFFGKCLVWNWSMLIWFRLSAPCGRSSQIITGTMQKNFPQTLACSRPLGGMPFRRSMQPQPACRSCQSNWHFKTDRYYGSLNEIEPKFPIRATGVRCLPIF